MLDLTLNEQIALHLHLHVTAQPDGIPLDAASISNLQRNVLNK